MKLSMKKCAVGLVAGVVASILCTPVSPASAAPGNCSTGYDTLNPHRSGWAWCTSGTGEYRPRVTCDKSLAPDYYKYGAWTAPATSQPYATCNSGDRAFGVIVQTR